MSGPVLKAKLHFGRQGKGRKQVKDGERPVATGRSVPRVAKLMALAIKFDSLIREGVVSDQAELARLGHVTRARVTHIMGLLQLAPDIQEAILWLPACESGRDGVTERDLRPIAGEVDWGRQRGMWEGVVRDNGGDRHSVHFSASVHFSQQPIHLQRKIVGEGPVSGT